MKRQTTVPRSSLLFLVPFLGLLYGALQHVYATIFVYGPSFWPFIAIPLVGALALWRGGRLGYGIAAAISLVLFTGEGTLAEGAFSSVTVTNYFLLFMIEVPILLASVIYSFLGLRQVWRSKTPPTPRRMIPASSLMIVLVVGFILGGVMIGMIAAPTELRLAKTGSDSPANIVIVLGAANSGNGEFYSPANYTVKAGTTVTWVNNDDATHSVTSTGGLFDSGPLPPGASFSYTFTRPGTYAYACTYHPWMTGIIVVTPG